MKRGILSSVFVMVIILSSVIFVSASDFGQPFKFNSDGIFFDVLKGGNFWNKENYCFGCERKAISNYCQSRGYESGYNGICFSKEDNEINENFNNENVCCFKDNIKESINFSSLDLTERSMHADKYYDPINHKYISKIFSEPVNYNDGIEFKPIDTTILQNSCEFDYCVRKGLYYADFKEDSTSQDIVKFFYNGSYVSYTPIQLKYLSGNKYEIISNVKNVKGYSEDNQFIYPEIYGQGLDLEYEYRNILLKESLIITEKSSLPVPKEILDEKIYLSLEFKLETKTNKKGVYENNEIYDFKKKIKWDNIKKEKIKGSIEIKTKNDESKIILPSAYAIDSENNIIELDYNFEKKGDELYVSILTPYDWLMAEERVYPIKIDPSISPNINVTRTNRIQHDWWNDIVRYEENTNLLRLASDKRTEGERCSYGMVEFDIYNEIPLNSSISEVDFYAWSYTIDDTDCPDNVDIYVQGYHEGDMPYPNPNGIGDLSNDEDYVLIDEEIYFGEISNLGGSDEDEWQHENFGMNGWNLAEDILNNGKNESFGVWLFGTCSSIGGVGKDCYASFGGKTDPSNKKPYLVIEYDAPCDIADGSSYALGCDCNENSDCPSGYYCDQARGPDACVIDSLCNGSIGVIVQDSLYNYLNGNYVYLNGDNQGQTDEDGQKILNFNNIDCGVPQNITIKCNDDSTVCDNKESYIGGNNEENYESLEFICDICSSKSDLFIRDSDLKLIEQSGQTNISILVQTIGIEASNVDVIFTKICNGIYYSNYKTISTITSSNDYKISVLEDLTGCEEIRVHVDPDNNVNEDSEINNEVSKIIGGSNYIYLNVDTGLPLIDDEIKDFIGDNAQVVSSSSDADVEVYVGRRLADDSSKNLNLESNWGIKNKLIYYNGLQESFPYNSLIGVRDEGVGGKLRIYVYGNEIDGTIAGVRKLIEDRSKWLTSGLSLSTQSTYLDKSNVNALYVFDFLHTNENKGEYRKNSLGFANIVRGVLRSETYDISIKRVLTANGADNVSLRLKHLNSELSPEFQKFTGNQRPVVFGHGLFGNLESMESLGKKIAKDDKYDKQYIRDVWLMEYSGGPNTDCETCPNYDMDDLTDWYWPALMGGVLKYSGENETDYVGYSAGGGVGIRSYEKWYEGSDDMGYYVNDNGDWEMFDLPADFVDHMALIAPMGAFDGTTFVTRCIDEYGTNANKDLSSFSHIDRKMISQKIATYSALDSSLIIGGGIGAKITCVGALGLMFLPSEKISYNFWQDITRDIQNKTDTNSKLTSINKLMLIKGEIGGLSDDLVVPDVDIVSMYENSNATQKYRSRVWNIHSFIPEEDTTYNPLLSKFLNDKSYGIREEWWYWIVSD